MFNRSIEFRLRSMPFHKGGFLSQTMHIEEGETVCERISDCKRHPRRENRILKTPRDASGSRAELGDLVIFKGSPVIYSSLIMVN